MVERDASAELRAENARLNALLGASGIQWRMQQPERASPASMLERSRLSTDEKVALFRRLFRGRTDVYPIRRESKTTAKSGYSPAFANEWRAGVCEKPRINYGDCSNRTSIPLSDSVIFDHLAGEHTSRLGTAGCRSPLSTQVHAIEHIVSQVRSEWEGGKRCSLVKRDG